MNWLLKIVDGPMKGAEVALIGGRRTSVGADDSCDLVIADQSFPAKAFDLDVSDTAVTLLAPNGDVQTLAPFTIRAVGTTAFAIGPAEGPWQPLVTPSVEEGKRDEGDEEEKGEKRDEGEKGEEGEEGKKGGEGKRGRKGNLEGEGKKGREWGEKKGRGFGCGCLGFLLFLLIISFLLWFFWGRLVERWPAAEEARCTVVEKVSSWWNAGKALVVKPVEAKVPGPSLKEIADQYGLTLEEPEEAAPKLSGNVARRTERLAIRALALAENARTQFDLTDDESFATAVSASLFAQTEGALKVMSASNRVVTLAGYAPSRATFEKVIRTLNDDVPQIACVASELVQLGGARPADLPATAYAENPTVVPEKAASAKPKAPAKPNYPIAGILLKPYPCVVLRNGERLCEGAQIGGAVLTRIEADRLVFMEDTTEIEWRP